MNFQDLKTKFKNIVDICVDFVIKYKRYFMAGCIFVLMAVVLFFGTAPYTGEVGTAGVTKKFKENKNTELDKLINDYYTAFAAGDIDTLKALAVPMCDKEVSYTALYSQYIESFNDIKIYTKQGLTDDSYLVTTEVSLKYVDVDTLVPGLDFFYVEKNEDGKLYINNIYGTFFDFYYGNGDSQQQYDFWQKCKPGIDSDAGVIVNRLVNSGVAREHQDKILEEYKYIPSGSGSLYYRVETNDDIVLVEMMDLDTYTFFLTYADKSRQKDILRIMTGKESGLAGTVIALVAETVVFAGAVCAVLVIAKKKAAA